MVNSFGCSQWMVPETSTSSIEGEGCFVFLFHSICFTLCHDFWGGMTPSVLCHRWSMEELMKATGRLPLYMDSVNLFYFCSMFLWCWERNNEEFVSFEWYMLERRWNDLWGFNGFWKAAAKWKRMKGLEALLGCEAVHHSFTWPGMDFFPEKGAQFGTFFRDQVFWLRSILSDKI